MMMLHLCTLDGFLSHVFGLYRNKRLIPCKIPSFCEVIFPFFVFFHRLHCALLLVKLSQPLWLLLDNILVGPPNHRRKRPSRSTSRSTANLTKLTSASIIKQLRFCPLKTYATKNYGKDKLHTNIVNYGKNSNLSAR